MVVSRAELQVTRNFLGIIGLWTEYQKKEVDWMIMTSAWNCVQAYFSSWMQIEKKDIIIIEQIDGCNFTGITGLDGKSTLLKMFMANRTVWQKVINRRDLNYQLLVNWMKENQPDTQVPSLQHFNSWLPTLWKQRITRAHDKDNNQLGAQATASTSRLSEPESIKTSGQVFPGTVDYKVFLMINGQKCYGILESGGKNVNLYFVELENLLHTKIKLLQVNLSGLKRTQKLSNVGEYESRMELFSAHPLVISRRIVEALSQHIVPGFLGWIQELNKKYAQESEQSDVLVDCWNFLTAIISGWKDLDLIKILDMKLPQGLHPIGDQKSSDSITGQFFLQAVYFKARWIVPIYLVWALSMRWSNSQNVCKSQIKSFLISKDHVDIQRLYKLQSESHHTRRSPN